MKIGKYIVKWKYYGHSYARPYVYEQATNFFGKKKLKQLWEGSKYIHCYDAEKMFPAEMQKWFQETVDEYELYTKKWNEFYETGKVDTSGITIDVEIMPQDSISQGSIPKNNSSFMNIIRFGSFFIGGK